MIETYFGIGIIVSLFIWEKPKGRYPYSGFGLFVALWPIMLILSIGAYFEEKRSNKTDVDIQQAIPNCPKCNAQMQRKTGQYGAFWGCSSFPKCKGTLNI